MNYSRMDGMLGKSEVKSGNLSMTEWKNCTVKTTHLTQHNQSLCLQVSQCFVTELQHFVPSQQGCKMPRIFEVETFHGEYRVEGEFM